MKLDLTPFRVLLAAGAIAVAAPLAATAADISGAGATFPYPIYAKWADAYKKDTGVGLNYQSIGSGGGIKQIKAKTVTFGASDMPLTGADLDKSGLVQFPMVMGGIVPVVNLEGIKPGELVIDGPTLAKIFLGKIKTWDDAGDQEAQSQRQAAEPGDRRRAPLGRLRHHLQLHRLPLQGEPGLEVEGRLDDRGRVAGRHRRQGQRGRRQQRRQTKGSIGYVEYAYAKQNKLTYANMINKDGKTVAPTVGGLPGRRRQCRLEVGPGYGVILTDQPGAQSWPIDRRDLHPDPQAAAGSGGRRRGPQVLRLGLRQGRQDGRRARLRPDARHGRRTRSRRCGRARSRTPTASRCSPN